MRSRQGQHQTKVKRSDVMALIRGGLEIRSRSKDERSSELISRVRITSDNVKKAETRNCHVSRAVRACVEGMRAVCTCPGAREGRCCVLLRELLKQRTLRGFLCASNDLKLAERINGSLWNWSLCNRKQTFSVAFLPLLCQTLCTMASRQVYFWVKTKAARPWMLPRKKYQQRRKRGLSPLFLQIRV